MKATELLRNFGQSLWLDNITRDLLNGGTLKRYIDELSITGLTSNPTIFDHAVKNSVAYDAATLDGLRQSKDGEALFFDLALEDITRAADLFRPVHERTNGVDGWVSLEVSPSNPLYRRRADGSGHPGLPLGNAAMAFVLWTRFLKHNPHDPFWPDHDRFILSPGHGSMLLYSLLHLTGYDLPLDELKRFRQWGSRAPGHPERGHETPGVEVSTGPLGQGFANGVGMAMAEAWLAARFNRPGFKLVDHFTYGIVSDADLMEGIASEAASLAGHLRLGKLIYLYDNNEICLSGSTNLSFTENVQARFSAYGWHTRTLVDGNNLEDVDDAIRQSQSVTDKPSLILVRNHIGFGSPAKHDTFHAHGSPLGKEEVAATKAALNWPTQDEFFIPTESLEYFRRAVTEGQEKQKAWKELHERYQQTFPEEAKQWSQIMEGKLPVGWGEDLPSWKTDDKPIPTREASGKVLNALAGMIPNLVGGSADLNPSTKTAMAGLGGLRASDG
jgi:transketolase